MNWRDHLRQRLLDIRPASVCALDAAAHQLAEEVLRDTPVHAPEKSPAAPCALALGVDALTGLDAQQARNLIHRTRLYVAPRILLAVPAAGPLDEPMFIALGFTLSATDTAENIRVHYYDIDTYKTVPDWLNARHWAHPERWEP
jgi:hypothetical protein